MSQTYPIFCLNLPPLLDLVRHLILYLLNTVIITKLILWKVT